jgi:hypothetical protein
MIITAIILTSPEWKEEKEDQFNSPSRSGWSSTRKQDPSAALSPSVRHTHCMAYLSFSMNSNSTSCVASSIKDKIDYLSIIISGTVSNELYTKFCSELI